MTKICNTTPDVQKAIKKLVSIIRQSKNEAPKDMHRIFRAEIKVITAIREDVKKYGHSIDIQTIYTKLLSEAGIKCTDDNEITTAISKEAIKVRSPSYWGGKHHEAIRAVTNGRIEIENIVAKKFKLTEIESDELYWTYMTTPTILSKKSF